MYKRQTLVFATVLLTSISSTSFAVDKLHFVIGGGAGGGWDGTARGTGEALTKAGKQIMSYIDQFPEPRNMEQGLFLQRLSDCLEESKNKVEFPLPTGSTILSNNYFWLHGRKPFKENTNLSRELLRIRGTFFN